MGHLKTKPEITGQINVLTGIRDLLLRRDQESADAEAVQALNAQIGVLRSGAHPATVEESYSGDNAPADKKFALAAANWWTGLTDDFEYPVDQDLVDDVSKGVQTTVTAGEPTFTEVGDAPTEVRGTHYGPGTTPPSAAGEDVGAVNGGGPEEDARSSKDLSEAAKGQEIPEGIPAETAELAKETAVQETAAAETEKSVEEQAEKVEEAEKVADQQQEEAEKVSEQQEEAEKVSEQQEAKETAEQQEEKKD